MYDTCQPTPSLRRAGEAIALDGEFEVLHLRLCASYISKQVSRRGTHIRQKVDKNSVAFSQPPHHSATMHDLSASAANTAA